MIKWLSILFLNFLQYFLFREIKIILYYITFNHVLNTLPFSAKIIVKEISGRDILDALEFSSKALPKTSSKFLQVSGIKFKVDESFNSSVVVDEFENFIKVDGERRVFDVFINDEKLDENKKYTIAFDDFLGDGGDGYSMFTKYNLTKDTSLVDNEAFKLYLETELNRNIPEKYKTTQGRIVKEKKKNSNNSGYYVNYFRKISLLLLGLMI